MWTNAASILLLGHAISRVTAACPPDLRSILLDEANEWSSGAVITFPEDGADFYNVTERWSPYEAPTFAAAISVVTEEDVIQAVGDSVYKTAWPRSNGELLGPTGARASD